MTVWIAFAWPSAWRMRASRSPCARRIAPCRSPSAVRICDCLMPSALRMAARRSRSGRTCCPLGPPLLLHRVADRRRRLDRLDLDPGHLDAPAAGGLVEYPGQVPVDLVA